MPSPLTNNGWGYQSNCYVCEQSNGAGLQIPFHLSDDETHVTADFCLGSEHSGAPSLLHGGVSLAILDEAQAWAVVAIAQRWGLTRSTEAHFDGAVFVDHPHTVRASVVDVGLKQVRTEAVIFDEGGVERALGLAPQHHGLLGADYQSEH